MTRCWSRRRAGSFRARPPRPLPDHHDGARDDDEPCRRRNGGAAEGDRCTAVASPRAARRSLSRAGLPPDTVNPLTGMGIQAGLAAALAGGRADRSCERCLFGSSATGGGRPERRSAIEVSDDLTVFDPELTGLPGGFTVIPRGERGDAAFNSAIQFRSRRRLTRGLPMPLAGRLT
jgi:hypothetical protein